MGIRVHALAKKLNMPSKELIAKIKELGFEAKGHMSNLEDDVAELVEAEVSGLEKKAPEEAPDKTVAETKKEEPQEEKGILHISARPPIIVRGLAESMGVKTNDLIRELMKMKVFAAINQALSPEVAVNIASTFGFKLEVEETQPQKEEVIFEDEQKDDPSKLKPRSPIVTMMGHVDHGKTTLLDKIRKTNVVDKEHGGITQHIGAYEVFLEKGRVVFLDTPGHQAFTAMRARGANVTDVVVLVVAADDGVMPQTREAIDHARAANVPIVVAINKIDKKGSSQDRVKQDLAGLDLTPEDWGGKTICVPVSALMGEGVEELLELLLLETDLLELKANPDKQARGVVIEAHLSKGRGAVATVLIEEGTLYIGDIVVCGVSFGRVRALINDRGKNIKSAGPATPVEIVGLSSIPLAGDRMTVVKNEKTAREYCQGLAEKNKQNKMSQTKNQVTLENLYEQISLGNMKELDFIVKADVQGSLGVLLDAIMKLDSPEVKVRIIHDGIGGINESDIMLASASKAIVIGFHVRPSAEADSLAQKEKVQVKCYKVIYEAVEELEKAVKGMLDPVFQEKAIGRVIVKEIFKIPKVGTVAGCYVQKGKIFRGSKVRLIRDDVEVYTGTLSSLKRFKDDVREVLQNYECGLSIANYQDIKEGDVLEPFVIEEVSRAT